MKNYITLFYRKLQSLLIIGGVTFVTFAFVSCDENLLDKAPLDKLSDQSFWKSENDAQLTLAGCYKINHNMWGENDWWSYRGLLWLEFATDNAYDRRGLNSPQSKLSSGANTSTNGMINNYWKASYKKIGRCNYFLENIDKVNMATDKKAEMIAEVKFIRACQYFYMSQYWAGVPLVTRVLTIDEANNVSRNSKEEVVSFIFEELNAAILELPVERPESEFGRVTKGAALAFKGRLELAEKKFKDAARTYEKIINSGVYSIDSRYEELFLEKGEYSKEIIFGTQLLEDDLGHGIMQHFYPYIAGGWHIFCPLNNIVDAYECTDGKTIEKSNIYDALNPFDNRDPRLYQSVLLPHYSTFKGIMYETHPDNKNALDRVPNKTKTGYGLRKFSDENYEGDLKNSGNNIPIIRYAEVLLSYLEAKLESGEAVSQGLLDATINQIRGRSSVNMPPVNELDTDKLRDILRRERRVEFAFEGIRYWDLLRWKLAEEVLVGKIYGAKVTDDPSNSQYVVDAEGHYYVNTRSFRADIDYLWPIPQTERDINANLIQNNGY